MAECKGAECKGGFSMSWRDRWLSAGWYSAVLAALVIAAWLSFAATASAQGSGDRSINFVVDTSGSMGGTPIAEAKDALRGASTAIPQSAHVGLRSYAGNCGNGGVVRVPLGPYDSSAFSSAVESLTAGGGTPTPDALRAGAADLPQGGERTLILISDGQSSCGDPCPVAEQIADDLGVSFRVHTVGFRAPESAESELDCIARVTGGTYVSASDREGLERAIGDAVAGVELDYVALGDSYSSGEGTRDYDEHQEAQDCHRGPKAWPRILQQRLSFIIPRIEHKACSGAKSAQMQEDYKGNPPQIPSEADESVDLVTLTAGGNDIDFVSIIQKCRKPGGDCADEPESTHFEKKLDNLYRRLTGEIYPALEKAYPAARIAHVGYPRITPPPGKSLYDCDDWLSSEEQAAAERLVQKLNGTIFLATQTSASIEWVDVTNVLNDRELCTENSWMNPLGIWPPKGWEQERGHPRVAGQEAYAEKVANELGFSPPPKF